MKKLSVVLLWMLFGIFAPSLFAQYQVKNVSMVSFNFSWGFYSPNPVVQNAWSEGDFGGLGIAGRALFATKVFNSKLSLGAEYVLHTLASEENGGSYSLTYGGLPVGSGATKDLLLAHSVQAIGDYLVAGIETVDFHVGAGFGIVFFSGAKERQTIVLHDVSGLLGDILMSAPADPMNAELSGSLRFLAAFPVARHTTLDPEVRYFRTFGTQEISVVQIAVGVSYWW